MVELLVAVALGVGVSLLIGDLIRMTYSSFSNSKVKQDATFKQAAIENQIQNYGALEFSADLSTNANLKSCLLGDLKPGCSANCCEANKDFEAFIVARQPVLSQADAMAGTTAEPTLYDMDGTPGCKGNCQYQMTAKYSANCLGDLPTCERAEFVKVTIHSQSVGNVSMKEKDKEIIYYVDNNKKPYFITATPDLSMSVASTPQEISLNASPGLATEQQYIIYEQCKSSNPGIAKVTCYGFKYNFSKIFITPVSPGDVTITLQLNDAQKSNNLSDLRQFKVTITPPP